jgi:hypothetical protein
MFNELPPTIYIGLGAIVAAIITALITFVNLITSKDQNISEQRQSWINSIREDISKFIGLASHMSVLFAASAKNEDEKPTHKKDYYSKTPEFSELYNRIVLRLNPDKDKEMIKALDAIQFAFSGESKQFVGNTTYVGGLTSKLREVSQKMLKKEWKRVKRGELSYLLTKWMFIIVIISSISFGLYKLNTHDITNQPVVEKLPNKPIK